MSSSADPILEAFAGVVERAGSESLVVSPDQAVTTVEIDRAASDLAAKLAATGIAAGAAIALAAPPGPAFLIGYLALRRLDLSPILCDSARPTPDRLSAIDRLGAAAFLTPIRGWPAGVDEWQLERCAGWDGPGLERRWAAIKLTSGSTGEPRGIAVTAEALLADEAQLASSMGIDGDDRIVAAVPLAHSYGFSSIVLPALVRGARIVVPGSSSPIGPFTAARALGATFFPTVPAFLAAWVRFEAGPSWPASLRKVIAAGAPLAAEVARAFRARAGVPVHVFYGASECGGIAYDRTGESAIDGSVGTAVDGVTLEIDADSGRLRVRSAAVATIYLPGPSPELGGGAFLTGDLARLEAGGEVRLLGRADEVVIVRGRNVQPREVEAVLRALPGVEEVTVFGIDGPDGPHSVLRAVVAVPGGGLDAARISAYCRARLAEHKVPRSLIVVEALPRTERGKLDRARLAALGAPVRS